MPKSDREKVVMIMMGTATYVPRNIDLNRVAELLCERHGVPAFVEMIGGNVATIQIGGKTINEHGDTRGDALVGPGWFDNPTDALAAPGNLSVGRDDNGATPVITFPSWWGEYAIAAVVALYVAEENLRQ